MRVMFLLKKCHLEAFVLLVLIIVVIGIAIFKQFHTPYAHLAFGEYFPTQSKSPTKCSPILNLTDSFNSKTMINQQDWVNKKTQRELLCWVHTTSKHHDTRVQAINKTWLKRCDYSIVFSNERMNNASINHYPLWRDCENKDNSDAFNKTIRAWRFVYNILEPKFDWYYKTDDDTYMIAENMMRFLRNYDPNKPHFFGAWFKQTEENGTPYGSPFGFNSGSGYVLSRETVRLLNDALSNDPYFCGDNLYEDTGLANCLSKLKIYPEKTTDQHGNHRFLPWNFTEMYHNVYNNSQWLKEPIKTSMNIFNSNLIQLHHIDPDTMVFMESLLYRIRTDSNVTGALF